MKVFQFDTVVAWIVWLALMTYYFEADTSSVSAYSSKLVLLRMKIEKNTCSYRSSKHNQACQTFDASDAG